MKKGSKLLRRDPTRTTTTQLRFYQMMAVRLRNVEKRITQFMVVSDVLGMKPRAPFTFNQDPPPREYEFATDAAKLAAFNAWFRKMVEDEVLFAGPVPVSTEPWTTEYVESAYRRGIINAYISANRNLLQDEAFAETSQQLFLQQSFGAPESMSKVRLLGTRAFEQLRGITAPMGAEMNHILAQGMAEGKSVEVIAREMRDRVGLSYARAKRIARTEIIHAHAEGQLDTFERLGVTELGIKAEWSTAKDDSVCPQCEPMEGQVFTIEEARGKIPLHPNCRCSWIPKVG